MKNGSGTTDHVAVIKMQSRKFRRLPLFLSLLLVPALCLAQSPDAVLNQKVLEELKAVRASLERLEKSQKALVALTRVQMDESQIRALEERRLRLSAQEQDLNNQIAAASRYESSQPVVVASEGVAPETVASTEATLAKAHIEQASRALRNVSATKDMVEQEIAKLKQRIAATEKRFEEASQ